MFNICISFINLITNIYYNKHLRKLYIKQTIKETIIKQTGFLKQSLSKVETWFINSKAFKLNDGIK